MESKGTTSAEITQIDIKSQESSNNITKDGWLISIEDYDFRNKPKIARVSSIPRKNISNRDYYDPLVVSIGPYHYGNRQLEEFQKIKIPIANKFCRACDNRVSIKQLYEEVAKVGKIAREFYEEGSTDCYDNELFDRMMFLDACFVLHFMFIETRNYYYEEKLVVDPVLEDLDYYLAFVLRDLFLLENQIPLLVLKVLLRFRLKTESQGAEFIRYFFENIMPSQDKLEWESKLNLDEIPHLLHLMRLKLIGPFAHESIIKRPIVREWYRIRSVTMLESVGIHLNPSKTGFFTDVKFKSGIVFGTLALPPIKVDELTKPLLLNLVAYENYAHGPSDFHISSYILLMDSLIHHVDDIEVLRKKRILFNKLDSDEQVGRLFKDIANDLVPGHIAYADDVIEIIDQHCNNKVQVWVVEMFKKYFGNPWAPFAFLGSISILALTMVQTYFAIFPR